MRAAHSHAQDYAHVIIGCHPTIGYVRGLFKADAEDGYVVDASNATSSGPHKQGVMAVTANAAFDLQVLYRSRSLTNAAPTAQREATPTTAPLYKKRMFDL